MSSLASAFTPALSPAHIIAMILIMWVITYALRLAPFLFIARLKNSPVVKEIGRTMPVGVMAILVVYTLRNTDLVALTSTNGPVPAVAGIATTMALHLWRSNVLLSMIAGIAVYGIVLHVL
ncbi:MAG: AzlD domain-containing protein [Actinomycetaceae bacterium]|nr:AzlD domain-containing protein [Actinomycetaceae bacterium]